MECENINKNDLIMGFYRGPHTVTDGLVLSLDAGNVKSYPRSGTTWFDKSGFGNNGTLTNGPTFNSGNGGSIVFDGVNDYVNLQKDINFPISGNSRTISVWFKTPSTYPSLVQLPALFAYGTTNWTNGFVMAWDGRSGTHISQYRIIISNYGNQVYNNTALLLNTLYNITVTKLVGSENYSFYLDGSIDGINTWTNPNQYRTTNTVLNNSATIGTSTQSPGNMYWKGNIYQTQIYNRALTATEILQNYNATKSRYNL
jgi:hypothetical protein